MEGVAPGELLLSHPRKDRRSAKGLAWASPRAVLEAHGLYDACILGSGDRAVFCAGLGRFDYCTQGLLMNPPASGALSHGWARPYFATVRGRIGYIPGRAFHLWHGEVGGPSIRRARPRSADLSPSTPSPTSLRTTAAAGAGAPTSSRCTPTSGATSRDCNEDGVCRQAGGPRQHRAPGGGGPSRVERRPRAAGDLPPRSVATEPPRLEAELGVDLWAMSPPWSAGGRGRPRNDDPMVRFSAGLVSPHARRGQVLKGRRLGAPADVIRIARLLGLLDSRFFPPVLAHRGCALLTRWVPGPARKPRRVDGRATAHVRPPARRHPSAPLSPPTSHPRRSRRPTGVDDSTGGRLSELVRGARHSQGQGDPPPGRPLRARDGKHRRMSHGLLRRQHHHHRRRAGLRRRQRAAWPSMPTNSTSRERGTGGR